jgi:hypothetical protein
LKVVGSADIETSITIAAKNWLEGKELIEKL